LSRSPDTLARAVHALPRTCPAGLLRAAIRTPARRSRWQGCIAGQEATAGDNAAAAAAVVLAVLVAAAAGLALHEAGIRRRRRGGGVEDLRSMPYKLQADI
jgi:hypothetical protein